MIAMEITFLFRIRKITQSRKIAFHSGVYPTLNISRKYLVNLKFESVRCLGIKTSK